MLARYPLLAVSRTLPPRAARRRRPIVAVDISHVQRIHALGRPFGHPLADLGDALLGPETLLCWGPGPRKVALVDALLNLRLLLAVLFVLLFVDVDFNIVLVVRRIEVLAEILAVVALDAFEDAVSHEAVLVEALV